MLAKRGPARQCRAQFLVLLKLWIQSISRVLLHVLRFELLMGHLLSTKSVSKKVEGSRRIWCRDRETGGQRQLDDTRVPPLGRRLLSCSRGVRHAGPAGSLHLRQHGGSLTSARALLSVGSVIRSQVLVRCALILVCAAMMIS